MFRIRFFSLALALLLAFAIGGNVLAASRRIDNIQVAPGTTICLPTIYAANAADISGTATRDGAAFAVFNGPTQGKLNPIYFTLQGTSGFRAVFTTSFPQGATFPGYFRVCATNGSQLNNTRVTLSIVTDNTP